MAIKLNLGCGRNHREGYVNVDKAPGADPDMLVDLEEFPWPFDDDSVEEILLIHTLEHLGQDTDVFLGIIKEIYRVSAPDARVRIDVPHPRHDFYLGDPSHVRPIIPQTLLLFSKKETRAMKERGSSNTPFADYLNVDFEIEEAAHILDRAWSDRFEAEGLSPEQSNAAAMEALKSHNNVVEEVKIVLRVVKDRPGNGAAADGRDRQ